MMKGPVTIASMENHQMVGRSQQQDVVDFSEYMWMGAELEEFDKKVEAELLEEELMEQCFEEMMFEEEAEWFYPEEYEHWKQNNQDGNIQIELHAQQDQNAAGVQVLNPDAPEFVPRCLEDAPIIEQER